MLGSLVTIKYLSIPYYLLDNTVDSGKSLWYICCAYATLEKKIQCLSHLKTWVLQKINNRFPVTYVYDIKPESLCSVVRIVLKQPIFAKTSCNSTSGQTQQQIMYVQFKDLVFYNSSYSSHNNFHVYFANRVIYPYLIT